jgi:hypothetical protein
VLARWCASEYPHLIVPTSSREFVQNELLKSGSRRKGESGRTWLVFAVALTRARLLCARAPRRRCRLVGVATDIGCPAVFVRDCTDRGTEPTVAGGPVGDHYTVDYLWEGSLQSIRITRLADDTWVTDTELAAGALRRRGCLLFAKEARVTAFRFCHPLRL